MTIEQTKKRVNFDQAKWLHINNYPWIPTCFTENGKECTVSLAIRRKYTDRTYYPRPEQHQVVEWLWEKHGIWVNVRHLPFNQKFGYTISGKYQNGDNGVLKSYDFNHFYTSHEAYSAAFDYIKEHICYEN